MVANIIQDSKVYSTKGYANCCPPFYIHYFELYNLALAILDFEIIQCKLVEQNLFTENLLASKGVFVYYVRHLGSAILNFLIWMWNPSSATPKTYERLLGLRCY